MLEVSKAKRIKKNDEGIDQDNKKRLIVIIEKCSLESAKVMFFQQLYIYAILFQWNRWNKSSIKLRLN